MSENIDPRTLESGNVLRMLRDEFLKAPSKETLFPFLSCLRDSQVAVPMTAIMSEEDQHTFLNVKKGDIVTLQHEMRMRPDILQSGDHFFFPIFSSVDEMPEDYRARFSVMVMPTLRCLNMAKSHENVCGLVLDAFTNPLPLEYEIADLIPLFESRLRPEP